MARRIKIVYFLACWWTKASSLDACQGVCHTGAERVAAGSFATMRTVSSTLILATCMSQRKAKARRVASCEWEWGMGRVLPVWERS